MSINEITKENDMEKLFGDIKAFICLLSDWCDTVAPIWKESSIWDDAVVPIQKIAFSSHDTIH